MSKKAMKLALEALEKVHYNCINSGVNSYASLVQDIAKAHDAIKALAEESSGTEQPAQQEPVAWGVDWGSNKG